MTLSQSRFVLVAVTALVCTSCVREPAETWGFVATLGRDTTSVERITRTGNRIVSDAVGRSPLVVRRRWEATVGPDGSVRDWKMDTHIANAPEGSRDLHHELELGDRTVRVVRETGAGRSENTFANPYARTVPWNAFLYGSYEVLFQAAKGLPDSTHIGHYFFEGWAEGKMGYAQVRRLGDGRVSITSTGLAGAGVAHLDDEGRMLSYSGEGTTYKQEVQRVDDVPDLDALFARFAADEKAKGVAAVLSTRDTMHAQIGSANIRVQYSRPLARGRTLVGGLIPYDRVWRTGANAATHLTADKPVRLAGVPLDAGTYTLWTLPTRAGVELVINRQTGQWGTGYNASHDIARVAMQVDTLDQSTEQFTIRADTAAARLVIEWGTFRWSVPIEAAR